MLKKGWNSIINPKYVQYNMRRKVIVKMAKKSKICLENDLLTIILLFSLIVTGLAFMLEKCVFEQTWTDEVYTLGIITYSYKNMLEVIAKDVHPPLYYIILKCVVDLTKLIYNEVNVVLLARIVSLVPFVLLMVISFTQVRKFWGTKAALLYGFLLTFMPKFMLFNITIRMYSWAGLFVTLTYLLFYQIIFEKQDRYIPFSFCALAAMYTHYFAAVSIAVLFLHMLIYLWVKKMPLIKFWISVSIIAVCYIPWLFVAFDQMSRVFTDYWIPPLSLRSFLGVASFVVCPPVNNDYCDGIICLAVGAIYLYNWLKMRKNNKELLFFSVTGFNMVVFTALFGITVSFIFRPIFIARYLAPSLGCFWLSYVVGVEGNSSNPQVSKIVEFIILLALGIVTIIIFESRSLVLLLS